MKIPVVGILGVLGLTDPLLEVRGCWSWGWVWVWGGFICWNLLGETNECTVPRHSWLQSQQLRAERGLRGEFQLRLSELAVMHFRQAQYFHREKKNDNWKLHTVFRFHEQRPLQSV